MGVTAVEMDELLGIFNYKPMYPPWTNFARNNCKVLMHLSDHVQLPKDSRHVPLATCGVHARLDEYKPWPFQRMWSAHILCEHGIKPCIQVLNDKSYIPIWTS